MNGCFAGRLEHCFPSPALTRGPMQTQRPVMHRANLGNNNSCMKSSPFIGLMLLDTCGMA